MLINNQSNNILAYIVVNCVLIVGLASLVYRKYTSRYMLAKYIFFNGTALVLIYLDGGVGSFFTIWLFLLALYVLYLDNHYAIIFAILVPLLYASIAPFSAVQLSIIVVIQRSVVIMATSLIALSLNRNLIQEALEKDRTQQNLIHLERSNKDLEQFALVASHDLKSPLIKIIQSINYIEENYGDELNPDIKNLISISKKSSEQLNELVTDLLTFSKDSINENSYELINGEEIVRNAIHNISEILENRNVEIEVSKIPNFVAIGSLITSLFQNIIHNAVKFNDKENPKVQIEAKEEDNRKVLFSIKDNGIGIDESNKDKIFNLFQRLGNGKKYPGTGVGLALCKRIVEIHQGEIWFESEKNVGSTFYIRLPNIIPRSA